MTMKKKKKTITAAMLDQTYTLAQIVERSTQARASGNGNWIAADCGESGDPMRLAECGVWFSRASLAQSLEAHGHKRCAADIDALMLAVSFAARVAAAAIAVRASRMITENDPAFLALSNEWGALAAQQLDDIAVSVREGREVAAGSLVNAEGGAALRLVESLTGGESISALTGLIMGEALAPVITILCGGGGASKSDDEGADGADGGGA